MTGLLLLALAALAQEGADAGSQVHISLSGRVELTYAARDRRLNEAALWTPGGLAPGSPLRDTDTFVLPDIALRFDIDSPLGPSVVEIGNLPLHFSDADPRLQQDRLGSASAVDVTLLQAWIEVFDALRIGVQNFVWDPLGLGHPLFLAPSRSESPWDELPDSTVPPFPASGTNTVPQTRRDQRRPVGVTARLGDLTLFALLAAEGGSQGEDEFLSGGHYERAIGDVRVGGVLAAFAGRHDRLVGTAGLTASWSASGLTISGEGYVQRGDAGGYPGVDNVRAEGNALRVVAGYAGAVVVQVCAVRISGDKRGDDRKEGRFLSYEDDDATLIVEGNDFGLDIDTNYESLQVSVGVPFDVGGTRLQPRLLVAAFRFLEAVPLPPDPLPGVGGRSRTLGTEVDASVDVAWSAELSFTFAAAWLVGARALETFTADADDGAWLFTLGARLRF